jgi:hypothetical protein
MAIQFHCPGCSQPIEVDDIHAGQTAACPYCQRVISVPSESELDRSHSGVARPTSGGVDGDSTSAPGLPQAREFNAGEPPHPPPVPGELHVGPSLGPRERVARTWGNYALILSVLSVLLLGVALVYGFMIVGPELMKDPRPSPESMAEIEAKLQANTLVGVASCGALVFAVGGLALGITSLSQSRRGNWRAIVSVVVCGLFIICACSGMLLTIATSGLAAPA